MTIAELLADLRGRDVRLWVEQDRLRCSAPAGALSAETKAVLASRKDEILAFLRHAEELKSAPPAIVPLKPEGRRPPLFAIPGHNGDVFCYVALARYLDADQPLLGVQPPGLDGSTPLPSLEALARYEAEQIRRHRARSPYLIAGYCAGGTIAFEVARQLAEQGQEVALLALFGSPFPTFFRRLPQFGLSLEDLTSRARRHVRVLASGSTAGAVAYLRAKLRQRRQEKAALAKELHDPVLESRRRVGRATLRAIRHYRPRWYPGRLDLFLPSHGWQSVPGGRPDRWRGVARAFEEHLGPDDCDIDVMLKEPHVAAIAAALRPRLDEIAGGSDSDRGTGSPSRPGTQRPIPEEGRRTAVLE
jgi:thioesterase domain-containing protein